MRQLIAISCLIPFMASAFSFQNGKRALKTAEFPGYYSMSARTGPVDVTSAPKGPVVNQEGVALAIDAGAPDGVEIAEGGIARRYSEPEARAIRTAFGPAQLRYVLFWREGKGLINVYGAQGEKISSVAGLDIPMPKALAVDAEGNLVVFGASQTTSAEPVPLLHRFTVDGRLIARQLPGVLGAFTQAAVMTAGPNRR